MEIVFVTSEAVPFAKTGGLADVAGALPKALTAEGVKTTVFMPLYQGIDKKKYNIKPIHKRLRLRSIKSSAKEFHVYKGNLPDSNVDIYFIDKDKYFNRSELYQVHGEDYADNHTRFHFFCLAVLESLKSLNIKPDVIHCNDWQTALIPLFLKKYFNQDPFYKNIASIYTIHNLAYHGLFSPEILNELQIPSELFTSDTLEFWGKVNFAKGGLVFADVISTVSEKYSQEIQHEEFGMGLNGLLEQRKDNLFGIINGVDYTVWNPKIDKKIKKTYSLKNIENKEENKKELLKLNNLTYKKNTPVLGLISRLTDQKGFDILAQVLEEILNKDLYFVILGTGDPKYHNLLLEFEKKYPDKLKANLKFDAVLAQLIYAGSDMFIMPSYFEPCGLGQLISLKYLTVPIVRATGGLADTIIDFDEDKTNGNGFTFSDYQGSALLNAIERALNYYQTPQLWLKILKNCDKADYSWDASAKKYLKLYDTAIKIKNSTVN